MSEPHSKPEPGGFRCLTNGPDDFPTIKFTQSGTDLQTTVRADSVVVILIPEAEEQSLRRLAQTVDGCVSLSIPEIRAHGIRIDPVRNEAELLNIIKLLQEQPEVEIAEPSSVMRII